MPELDAVGPPVPSRLAAQLLDDQSRRWQDGDAAPIEAYLERYSELREDADGLLDLIFNEILLREERGEVPDPAEYLARFPWMADQLRPHFAVHHFLGPETVILAGDGRAARATAAPAGLPDIAGYEVLREIGRGGMGVVYQARHRTLRRLVALKMILAGPHAAPQEVRRLQVEAEAIARVQHPNIVQIYEVGIHDGRPYLALEFVDGEALDQRLAGTPHPARESAHLIETLARAVHVAHQAGIVHRDLKPANILLQKSEIRNPKSERDQCQKSEIRNPKSERDQSSAVSDFGFRISDFTPKVTDFGLAKQMEDVGPGPTQSGDFLGTPAYAAPEQAVGNRQEIGPATDLYALGAILYEMLTGRPPFQATTPLEILLRVKIEEPLPPRRLQPKLPRDLETICLKCLHKEPRRRYASALDLADDLRRFQEGRPIHARPVRAAERGLRWCRRNPALAAACALASLALVAASLVAVGFGVYQAAAKAQIQAALEDAQRERARLARYQGYTLYEQGKLPAGMLWLARALRALETVTATDEDFRQEQEIRSQLRAWSHQLRPLRAVRALPRLDITPDLQIPLTQRTQAVSPDGRLILTGGIDGRVWLGAVAGGQPLQELQTGHTRAVTAVAFSPDGALAATGSGDGTARLWEVGIGQPRGAPLVHGGVLYDLAFSPDGKLLLTAGSDETAQLWDVTTGQPHGERLRHKGLIDCAAFSPDGRLVLTASWDRTAQLWETATGRRRGRPLRHKDRIEAVAFSPDGKLVLTGSRDATARLWETEGGLPVTAPLTHLGPVPVLAFSSDGHTMLTGTLVGSVYLRDVPDGKPRGEPLAHPGKVLAAAFSPDGRLVVTGSADGNARLWDAGTGRSLGSPLAHPKDSGGVWGVGFSADGRQILTRTQTEARLWDAATAPRALVLPHPYWVGAVAVAPDGNRIATGTAKFLEGEAAALVQGLVGKPVAAAPVRGAARQWDARTGEAIGPALPHRLPITAIAYSPDGRRLATGSGNPWSGSGEARLWDAGTGQPIGAPLKRRRAVTGVAFSPDGRTLIAGSRDRTATLIDAGTGRLLRTYSHRDGILAVAFSLDGTTILAGTEDKQLVRWQVATGNPTGEPFLHPGEVAAVAVSPDGKTALTGCSDHGLRLWNLESGALLWTAMRHDSWVRAVAFSPDGREVLSASGDGTAQLWKTATGRPWGPALRHTGMVVTAAFHPDGHAVLTGGLDKTARLWEVREAPLEGSPERIALWTEVITGQVLDAAAEEQLLVAAAWQQRRRRLEQLGGPPDR